jgi:hypothetical protein
MDETTTAHDAAEIAKRCIDAPGYLLFAAVLTGQKDAQGNPLVEFQYRRYHLGLEDAKGAAAVLAKEVNTELQQLMQEPSEG